jgi:multiple sugar transport system permease protein
LIQLIVEAFGGKIPSTQWYFRGPSIAWMAIMFQNIFTTVPTFMIMYLAALQDINPALYEAASIEGANKRQVFKQITRPLLRPITMMIVVLGTIGTLQVFDQVYLATSGGPLKTSLTPVFLIFTEALGVNGPITMGYASALAFILAVIIFALTFVQRRILTQGTEMY